MECSIAKQAIFVLAIAFAAGCSSSSSSSPCDRVCDCVHTEKGSEAARLCSTLCEGRIASAPDPVAECKDELDKQGIGECRSECASLSAQMSSPIDAAVPRADARVSMADARVPSTPDARVPSTPDARPDPSPECGDGVCHASETATCCQDCGCADSGVCQSDGSCRPLVSVMSWPIEDTCNNGEKIYARFFDLDDGGFWPADPTLVYVLEPLQSYTQTFACQTGNKICYGAYQPSHGWTWGLGIQGDGSCETCCRFCTEGAVFPTQFGCF